MFENLIEKWQSRRKTISISPAETKSSNKCAPIPSDSNKSLEPSKSSLVAKKEISSTKCSSGAEETTLSSVYKLIGDTAETPNNNQSTLFEIKMPDLVRPTLANCPSLLFVAITLICLLSLNLCYSKDHHALADTQPSKSIITDMRHHWAQLGRGLIERIAARDSTRWATISEPSDSIRDVHRRRRPENFITRTLNRIGNRIGSRNTIRVHNAFRDLAWRLLSGLSMPTPVIYELRRQHLYSVEDDLMNDSLFNKNTTKTIRSRRLLWPKTTFHKTTRSSDDDDDGEPNK